MRARRRCHAGICCDERGRGGRVKGQVRKANTGFGKEWGACGQQRPIQPQIQPQRQFFDCCAA